MSTLSEKLAGIVLPVDHFGSHFDAMENITDSELEIRNFCYASEKLRDIWQQDNIHGKKVFCNNARCCSSWRNDDAEALLSENDRFLPPFTKDQDGHLLSPIYILQYMDKKKLPGYNQNCPSIPQEMYSRLTCPICQRYFPTLAFLTQYKKTIYRSAAHRKPKISAITDNCLSLLLYVYVETILDLSISDG
ncbi:2875_t:CDS:2 [Gigaspora margarita]|uniref:2875_t:CDS:1 n=1 Tax=Gigaspora margarita TaxID=4874 RepID=A0ABN7W843_GIGMA|nr:2875_t:CDS:2 [Gigaspora margarita]